MSCIKLTLFFSENEQKVFLERRGYVIYIKTITCPIHRHGSSFYNQDRTVVFIKKSGEEIELSKAFEMEMKNKLLTE